MRHHPRRDRARRRALLALAALAGSCGRAPGPATDAGPAATYPEALARAAAAHTQLVVHFRVPGRPVSDAMDAALAPSALAAIAADVVHLRLDASQALDLCHRLCGTSTRAGPGLATCIVDPGAPDDAFAVHVGYLDGDGLRRLLADAASLRRELARCDDTAAGSTQRTLVLAEHLTRCGHRGRARALLAGRAAEPACRAPCAARLARLAVEDGDLTATRQWLGAASDDAHSRLTRAMLHLAAREARVALPLLRTLDADPTARAPSERAGVLLQLGRAWHECGHDADALATFARLTRECAGTEAAAQAEREATHVRADDHGHSHAIPP